MFNLNKLKKINNINKYKENCIVEMLFDCSCNECNYHKASYSCVDGTYSIIYICCCGISLHVVYKYKKIRVISTYNRQNLSHNNTNVPSEIYYDNCGNIMQIEYREMGVLSNPLGYAVVSYSYNETFNCGFGVSYKVIGKYVKDYEYWVGGKMHNSVEPAKKNQYFTLFYLKPLHITTSFFNQA